MDLQARYRLRLRAPSVAMVLFILPLLSLCNTNSYQHSPADSVVSYTNSCRENWCGETWRANQILRYTYNTTTVRRVVNVTNVEHNCSNAASSLECSEGVVDTSTHTITKEVKQRILVNQTRDVDDLKNHGAIFTDNILNHGRDETNDTYSKNMDIVWQVRIPRGCRLILRFDRFDVESNDMCTKDYFSVQTSKQAHYRKYCNRLDSIEIRKRRRVQFVFHSDHSVSKTGISARMCFDDWPTTENSDSISCNCNAATTTERRRRSPIEQKSLELPRTVPESKPSLQDDSSLTERESHSPRKEESILKHLENSADPILRRLSQSYRRSEDGEDELSLSHQTAAEQLKR